MLRFLIIRFSSIGDIVLTSPVIRCLKKQVPDAEVHFLTRKIFAEVAEHNPYIDKKILFDDHLYKTIRILRKNNYDYIIDLHHNLRTFIIKTRLGKKSFSFSKLNFEKWMMVNFKINRLPAVHLVDRYLETLKFFGVENDGAGLDYFLPPEVSLPFDLPDSYCVFAIGAKHETKQLPAEKIAEIIRASGKYFFLTGGKDDFLKGEKIISMIAESSAKELPHAFNACGKLSIHESAFLISKANSVVTHDSGMMHIAAAFKKKIISVWGNTIPEFGMTPYYGNKMVKVFPFEIKDLPCRPCSKIGYSKCPKGHFRCMLMHDEHQIVQAINEL